MLATLAHLSPLLDYAIILFASTVAIFLFWRLGRHDLVDSQLLFDTAVIAILGGLAIGRIWDFLVRVDKYHFSITRLVFFNAYGGIDFTGVIFGFGVAALFFLRGRKEKFLEISDMAAAPIVFGQFLVSALRFALSTFMKKTDVHLLYFAVSYFVIFWILARLSKRKHHAGFFVCFYLFLISIVDISLFWTDKGKVMVGHVPYKLVLGFGLLGFSLVLWYICSRRDFRRDIKSTVASFLLFVFRFKRTVVSMEESNNLAKLIILSPYYLAKVILAILKFIGSEIISGLTDFLVVLGIKQIR